MGCLFCKRRDLVCIPYESNEPVQLIQDGNKQLQRWQLQMDQLDTNLETLRELMNRREWFLRIVDGNIQVESRIRNLRELFEYNQASIRYLSPFQHFFRREHIRFKGVPASVALASTGLVVRHATLNKTPRQTITEKDKETTYELMGRLVNLYMERYNAFVGFIHPETFFKHYNDLDDPLSSPLVLAICVDTIAYFHAQLEYSTQEKRDLAEYFYTRCRDMILDMVDDPERRLEAVVSTNLLVQYLVDILLEYTEARRLITIALLACHELDNQELSLIENTMFQRSHAALKIAMASINVVVDGKFDFSGISLSNIHVLSDEPQTIDVYARMWKHILALAGSEYITTMVKHIGYGQECELRLDLILQFEPVVQAWWKSLSNEFRLCDDPFDLKAVYQAIENVQSSTDLIPLALIHVITVMIQPALLQPYSSVHGRGNDDIITILRERSRTLSLCSAQALIYIMKKHLEVDIEGVVLSFSYMMSVLHSVCTVVSCLRVQLPPEMQNMLFYWFTQLSSIVPSDHHVPESATKLETFITTSESDRFAVYEKYPMPKLALLSDIFQSCFRQLNFVPTTPNTAVQTQHFYHNDNVNKA
ncbi:hypothetical protein BJV82DRAFT_672299 [Fennellomyces sp. T-0311]|nr:hypothetical protein BJV82DRAFT_672299 [Fennellomyces sp. T-0311]